MKQSIFDLLETIPAEDVAVEENALLSPERIKARTMKTIYTTRKPRRILFRTLAAAAILTAFAMSVLAVEQITGSGNWLDDYFSGREVTAQITENQLALLDQGVMEIGQSVTSGGYTVTLDSAITDGYRACLNFTVEAPRPLNGDNYSFLGFGDGWLGDSEQRPQGAADVTSGGFEFVEDDSPEDNRVTMVLKLGFSDRQSYFTNGEEITLSIQRFSEHIQQGDAWERQILAAGPWDFTFAFPLREAMAAEVEMLSQPLRCSGRRMLGGHHFDVTLEVTSFRLRTLSASCVVKKPLTGWWEGVLVDSVWIVNRDGTKLLAHWSMSRDLDGDMELLFDFDQPISFQDVAYVEFAIGDRAYMPGYTEE